MSDQGGDTRIELMFRLEAALKRIEQLEAALRKIAELEYLTDEAMQKIAEDALDPSSAPEAST
jgi:hypothetical protein